MPRPFVFNLQDLLKFARSKEVQVESHSTMELITTATDTTERIFRLATAKLTIDGVPYKGALKEIGAIKQSITRTTNRTEVVITNLSSLVDSDVAPFIPVPPRGQTPENLRLLLGADFINKPNEIQGAKVKIGRYWKNLETGQEFHEILFRGVVQASEADQDAVRLAILSDINAASIGGGRRVARKCQWKFRDPTTCTYSGVELACNKIFTSAGGCSGRTNEHHFGGFIFIQPKNSVAGGVGTGAPPNNQIVQNYNGSTYTSQALQPKFAFQNATFTNDTTNQVTRITPGLLAGASVIEGANPSLELRDTDAADFIFDLNANVLGLRFVGGSTMMTFSNTTGKVSIQTGIPLVADTIEVQGGGGLRDANANEILTISSTGSAVNEFTVANAATGNGPALSATGSDTNIPIILAPKGNGRLRESSAVITTLGGQFANNFTAANNSSTTETDLHSHSLAANFFHLDGDELHFRFGGTTAANANQKTIKLYVGGTVIYNSTATSALNNVKWLFDVHVSRIDSDSVRVVGYFFAGDYFVGPANNTTGGTGLITAFDTDVNSLTFTGSITVKVTGQSNTGSNDVTQDYSTLKRFRA